MRDQMRGVVGGNINDIWQMLVDVAIAGGFEVHRIFVEQIIHDGEVVRRQVPQHVHVRLEEAKINTQ